MPNKFLSSRYITTDLASESTQKKVCTSLTETGIIIDTTSSGLALEDGGNLASIQTNTFNANDYLAAIQSSTSNTNTKIQADIPILGQKTSSASMPVVISSNQSEINVKSSFGGQLASESTLSTLNVKIPTKNQKTMSGSSPVVLASNHSSILTHRSEKTYLCEFLKNLTEPNPYINAIGNYTLIGTGAVGPKDFTYTSTDDNTYIKRMIVQITDGNNTLEWGKYGGIPALANGIQVFIDDGISKSYITDPALPITNNIEWAAYCYDVDIKQETSGPDSIAIRWTFSKGNDSGLNLPSGYDFGVKLDDSMVGLLAHIYCLQGYIG